ncbi:phage baseplate assembly protein V [Niveibacterium umoris]|uniref:phage baseplate assembly protein V n=1 Tax=Niveibacterium umoris TaxID=1193620 RepID=UPI003B84A8B8
MFPWRRSAAPTPSGLTHDTERATGNESAGIWVQIIEWAADPNWGSQFTPPIGSELLVGFIDEDPDCPQVIGSTFNGSHTPPFDGGVEIGRITAAPVSPPPPPSAASSTSPPTRC